MSRAIIAGIWFFRPSWGPVGALSKPRSSVANQVFAAHPFGHTSLLVVPVVVDGVEGHADHLVPAVQPLPNPETAQHAHFDLHLARPQLDGAERVF